MNEENKITNSDRLASIERYLYGQDLDGKQMSGGHQSGWSLRQRLQENIAGDRHRHNSYTIKNLSKDLDRITKDLKKVREIQTTILISIVVTPVAIAIGWGIGYFL